VGETGFLGRRILPPSARKVGGVEGLQKKKSVLGKIKDRPFSIGRFKVFSAEWCSERLRKKGKVVRR